MFNVPQALQTAVVHHQAGRLEAAERIYREVLAANSREPDALHLLGVVYHQKGRHAEAVDLIRRAIRQNRTAPAFHNNLGDVYRALDRLPDAVACFKRALRLKPDFAEAHNNLGNAYRDLNELADAIACLERAVRLRPDYIDARHNLGNALKDVGRFDEAAVCYRQALEANPGSAPTWNNLGNVLREGGRFTESIGCFRRALEIKPDYALAYNNLANTFKDCGMLDEAISHYRRAVELDSDYPDAFSNLLLTLQYRPGVTPGDVAETHAVYQQRYAAPLRTTWKPHQNARDPEKRLRLGFVSCDFSRHPVGYHLLPVVENLDKQTAEVVCYNDRIKKDTHTLRFQAAASIWRDVAGWSAQRLADQILADGIDILLDLAGHTAGNRLLTFAPLQITWAGYEGTTGLAAMDYILADRYVIPEGAEQYYCEKVLRMPGGYLCYDPPEEALPVGPLPAIANGRVTFASFNNLVKITREVVALWARIMCQLPQSQLVLRYNGLGDEGVRRRYLDLFASAGVDPQRLSLLPRTSRADYLATYSGVDVALDPFPFTGGATTCDAMWMGVPVVIFPGQTFAGRHSLSHLTSVGLTETIAHSPDEYVELAVALAGDLPRLAGIRAGLRQRMALSSLCDGKRFAEQLLQVLRTVWRQWTA